MKQKLSAAVASALCAVLLSGCGLELGNLPVVGPLLGGEKPEYMTLDGEWLQINSPSGQDYQGIYIAEDYMEIYWILGSSQGAALYWAGTFTPPKKLTEDGSYTWESTADTSRTTLSLLTDKSAAKSFTYENGRIIYPVDYEDVEMNVKAERKDWGHERLEYWGTTDMFDMVNGVYQNFLDEGSAGGDQTTRASGTGGQPDSVELVPPEEAAAEAGEAEEDLPEPEAEPAAEEAAAGTQ